MTSNSVDILNAKGIKLKEWDKRRLPLKFQLNIDHQLAFRAEGKTVLKHKKIAMES